MKTDYILKRNRQLIHKHFLFVNMNILCCFWKKGIYFNGFKYQTPKFKIHVLIKAFSFVVNVVETLGKK